MNFFAFSFSQEIGADKVLSLASCPHRTNEPPRRHAAQIKFFAKLSFKKAAQIKFFAKLSFKKAGWAALFSFENF